MSFTPFNQFSPMGGGGVVVSGGGGVGKTDLVAWY